MLRVENKAWYWTSFLALPPPISWWCGKEFSINSLCGQFKGKKKIKTCQIRRTLNHEVLHSLTVSFLKYFYTAKWGLNLIYFLRVSIINVELRHQQMDILSPKTSRNTCVIFDKLLMCICVSNLVVSNSLWPHGL